MVEKNIFKHRHVANYSLSSKSLLEETDIAVVKILSLTLYNVLLPLVAEYAAVFDALFLKLYHSNILQLAEPRDVTVII